jgi:uncharacterized protein YjdB
MSQQFAATGTYSDGSTQTLTSSVTWSSSSTTVATIASSGSATGTAVGTTTITASSSSITASAALNVGPAVLVSIAVTPANPSFALGTTQTLVATGTYSDGSTLVLITATWTTANSGIATVTNLGVASSVALGATTVTATLGAISGSTTLTISPAVLVSIAVTPAIPTIPLGTTEQFTATATYTDGSTQNITDTVQWSSDTPAAATISNTAPTQGLASSVGEGTATITATTGSISGSTTVTVTAASLVSIAVTPAAASIALGTTQQFTATGTFTDGSIQNLTSTATWSSDAQTTATINPTGLAQSIAIGTANITATSGTVSGTTELTVTAATLVSIAITPPTATVALGTTQQFTATGTYTDSSTQNLTQSGQWSSTAATVATISNTTNTAGLASTLSTGTTTIGISSGTISATATLVVNPAALVSIAINPQTPTIALGTTQQFTATGTYTDGSTQDLTTVATWSSSLATVAIISNTVGSYGLATSAGQGAATISATSGSISSSTTLSVTQANMTSIVMTPSSIVVASGYGVQFTATATYSDGSSQNITQSANWSSSVPGVGTVNSNGFATGLMQGNTNIIAAFGNMSASGALTVTAPLLVSINISPSSSSVTAGSSVQLTATGIYSDGSTQNVTSIALWSSSANTIAGVSSAGLVTGIASGTATVSASEGGITSAVTTVQVLSPIFTLTVTGAGTGSVSSADGEISNCSSGGGACSGTYNVGATVTLTPVGTTGSSFSWSNGTGGAAVCSGSGACTFTITSTTSLTAIFTPFGGPEILASPTFGIDLNSGVQFPSTINQGTDRLWDTPGVTWPFVEISNNIFNWASVDNVLATMAANSIHTAQVVLSRTPNFATSAPGDKSCSYYSASSTGTQYAPGQCDPPSDLNSDGTGANLYWRNWVAAYATHVSPSSGYTNTHAHVLYWETWNEPDTSAFWKGSYDQLIRMEQDLYCIIKGGSFIIRATGETCSQVWRTVTSVNLTGPTDTTAYVLMPSYHAQGTALTDGQNFLYCNDNPATSCHTGGAGQTDVINFHMKPGNNYPTSLESVMSTWAGNIDGILQSSELAKPLFNTEGGYSSAGWTAPYTDANMQAAYIARIYIYSYSLGISGDVWYDWSPALNGLGSSNANTAYSEVYNWMVGSTFGSCTVNGTVYTCTMTLANGVAAAAIWDSSQTCTPCTTANQTVGSEYLSYLTLASGPETAIVGNTVPVGIQPILVQAQ